MESFYGKALIIDNNHKFLEEIKDHSGLMDAYPCMLARSFSEANSILKQPKHRIRVVFLSSSIGESHGMSELKLIKESRPQLPVILVSHAPEKLPAEMKGPEVGFLKILEKPSSFRVIVSEIVELFKARDLWKDVQASSEEKDVELTLADEGYIPTLLADYVLTPKSFFNVFIKLGPSKFIKILNAGDVLQQDLIEKYARKNVKYLYISAEEQKKYINLCEEVSRKLLARADVSLEHKAKNVANLGANISQNLIHTGISAEKLDTANKFLNQSISLMRSMRIENASLKSFLENIELKEHPSSVSFLAGIIANEVGFESSKIIKLVGFAGLVHDIGLYELDPTQLHEAAYLKTPEGREIFDQHARRGAEILRSNGGFDEVVCLTVEQHHLRRRGSDSTKRTSNINLTTEIIGVADELQNMLSADDFTPERFDHFKMFILPDFSPQIEKAVTKLLARPEKR